MKLKEIFAKFSKKSDNQDELNERINDFAVLEEKELADPIDEDSTDSGIIDDEDYEDDFDELDYLDQLEQEEFEETDFDDEFETEGDNFDEFDYEDEDESIENEQDLDSLWNENSYDEWDGNESAKETETISVSEQQQEKHVVLTPLKEYQDLAQLNEVIKRNKQMVSNEELIKRLDVLETDESELSKLDKIKKDYITSRIYSTDIQNLTQNFVDNIDVLVENTKLELAEAHDNVLTIDYEERAIDLLESDLMDIESEYEEDIANNESKEEEVYQNRLENFIEKQSHELEAFKREQEQQLLDFKDDHLTKKQTNIDMYGSERLTQFEKEKEKLLSEGVYKQEQLEANKLNPFKREILNTFESELKEASKNMKSKLKEHLNQIRAEVDKKEHEWKTEIHNEEMRNEEIRKREIEEDRVRLEREAFELDRQERLENLKLRRQRQDSYNRMDDQIQRDNDSLRKELNEVNSTQSELTQILLAQLVNQNNGGQVQVAQQPTMNHNQNEKESKKNGSVAQKYVIGGLSLLIVIVLAIMTFTMLQNRMDLAPSDLPTREDINISQSESGGVEQLTEEISLLRKQIALDGTGDSVEVLSNQEGNNESSDEEKSLDSFLLEGAFEEAIEIASTDNDLDQITNEMRKQEALVELINFNQRFDTPYGKLDEYVLRNNIWEVFYELMDLSEERLFNMNKERRNDVVLFMYQNDFISYGNWLLENREGVNE